MQELQFYLLFKNNFDTCMMSYRIRGHTTALTKTLCLFKGDLIIAKISKDNTISQASKAFDNRRLLVSQTKNLGLCFFSTNWVQSERS